MTRRERILLSIVGAMSLLALGYFGVLALFGDDPRLTQISNLEAEIEAYQRQIRLGAAARRRIGELETRALPADAQMAVDRYQAWLFDRVDAGALRERKIDPLTTRSTSSAGQPIKFSVSGIANLGGLTRLLASFYQVDYLHQIRQLKVRPIEGTKDLDILLVVEAMSLPGVTTRNTLPELGEPRIAAADLENSVRAVIERNLFAPENNVPRLARISDVKVELGKSVSIEPKATDPDELDQLSWSLFENESTSLPVGASIDPASGKFRWTPKKIGTFAVEFQVSDDGFPAKVARQRVSISVVQPPPEPVKIATPQAKPKPSFDAAKYAFVISTTQIGDQWQMWLHDRINDKIQKLRLGDRIDIGTVQATVIRIAGQEVELDADGKRLLISIGESLTEASELPAGGI